MKATASKATTMRAWSASAFTAATLSSRLRLEMAAISALTASMPLANTVPALTTVLLVAYRFAPVLGLAVPFTAEAQELLAHGVERLSG